MDKIPPLVFHADWFDIIEDLPQEQQLEVYRAIMLYAFRGEKTTNPFARATTALMRKFIDSDRSKYEKAIQQRKEAIRKRWEKQKNSNTTEYNRTESNTTEYNTNTITTNQDQDQDQDTIAKAIGVVNNTRTCARAAYADSNLLVEFFAPERQASLEALAMQLHVSIDELKAMAKEIANEWTLTKQTHPSYNDASRHLISVLRKKRQWSKPQTGASSTDPKLGIGEYRNSKGQRTYANGSTIVPESAPPRPSAGHWWGDASKRWEDMI